MPGSTSDLSYTESKQFALNFPVVMAAVSNYMKVEYDEGRLRDVNYATVQAQAIQSGIQATLTLVMQSDTQKEQTNLIAQQALMVMAQTAEIAPNAEKARAVQDAQITQIASETALNAKQALMVVAQTAEIAPNAEKARAVQDAQIGQVAAETAYTNSKKTVMEQSRIDNLLIEAEKAQMQQLATVGAGGLVPSTNDFDAGNKTRQAVYDRARAGDGTLPPISFSAGTTYIKAV